MVIVSGENVGKNGVVTIKRIALKRISRVEFLDIYQAVT